MDSLIWDWQFAAAESLCNCAKGPARSQWGDDSFNASEIRLREVRLARARGDSSAFSLSRELVGLRRSFLPPGDARLVPALLEYAQALKKLGKYDETASALDECALLAGAASPPDSVLIAQTLQDRAAFLMERRDLKSAEAQLRQAYGIRRRMLGDNHRDTARSHLYIAILEFQTGRLDSAARDYDGAVSTLEAVVGRRHPDYLWGLNARASFLQSRGNLKAAAADYEYILRVRRERGAPEDANLAWTMNSLAIICQELTDFAKAESLYSEAYRIRRAQLGDHWLTARSLTNCGAMMFYRGEYLKSRELLDQALAIFRNYGMERDPDAGLCLLDLGAMHQLTGDMETARDYYDRARAVFAHAGRPQDLMASLGGLGNCCMAEQQPTLAERFFRDELATAIEKFGTDSRWTGAARIDLALCLSAEKRLPESDSEFAAGLAAVEHSPDGTACDLGSAVYYHGREMLDRGKYAAAAAEFRRSIDLMNGKLEPSHPHMIRCWIGMARAAEGAGHSDEARETALKANELEMQHLHDNIGYMTERHALLYRNALESAADVAVGVVSSDPACSQRALKRTWEAVLNSRVLVLDELIARGREERRCPPAEKAAFRTFVAARSRLANLYVRAASNHMEDRYAELLDKAVREREASERAWAAAVAHRRGQKYDRIGLARVRTRLPEDAVLVAYVRYATRVSPGSPEPAADTYGAFVGRRSGDVAFVRLGDAALIDRSIEAWKGHMMEASSRLQMSRGGAEAAYFDVGDPLRREIWDPLVPFLGGASKVLIVPDGLLHIVSFAALPVDRSRFLIDEGRLISIVAAEKDILRRPAKSGTGLLAIGDPDFDSVGPGSTRKADPEVLALRGADDCRALDDFKFDRLPATGEEASSVAGLWRSLQRSPADPVALIGASATEGAFKKMAPGLRVLHIATHGFFVPESCTPQPAPADRSRTLRSASLRSGLALAGANVRTARPGAAADADDGILTAEEIGSLDLNGVELAVLSACNSGQGESAVGEGIFGLRRAFQASGVRDLVIALWPIGDRATAAWMNVFYRELWAGRKPTAEAARIASLEILDERRRGGRSTHPFYWGSFMTVGDCQ